jgi:DNA sulfur modification protein DndD
MAKLTINKISIQNFGPFREQQTFDLDVSDSSPVILVKALNGSGKTTLLTSLQIGLYGYKAVNAAKRSDYDFLVSSLQRKDASGNAQVEIVLTVERGAGFQVFTIRREWITRETGVREVFKVYQGGIEDIALTEDWDDFINSILPVELVHLFLFDGEKIEALANPERLPQLLRRATEVFLGLGGIDALASDLKAVERRAGGKKSIAGELTEVHLQLEQHQQQLDSINERIEILAQKQAQARLELDDAQRKAQTFSAEAQRSGLHSYQKAGELKGRLEACNEQYRQARAAKIASLENPLLPLAWLGGLWEEYRVQWLEDKKVKNAILLSEEFSRRDQRILAALANKAPLARQAVANLFEEDLQTFESAKQRVPVLLSGGDPSETDLLLKQAKNQLRLALVSVEGAQRHVDKAQKNVDSIPAEEQLAGVFFDMQKYAQIVSSAELRLSEMTRELSDARTSQSHVENRLNAARQKLRTESKESELQLQALEAAERAKTALHVFRERLLASKAQWLSKAITVEFTLLLRKRNMISRVVVEPNTYAVSIEDVNGDSLPMERLSAGERQILAIAVLSALIRERKGRFPVVVDTPLARLDRTHREALVHNFFAKVSHQVLILSTDEEVEGSVHAALEQHLSREYDLSFDDANRCSVATVQAHNPRLKVIL